MSTTSSTSLGTTSIDGLYSGLDTQSIIDSLAAVQEKPIELLNTRKTERATALTTYQSLTAQVLALQATANSLGSGDVFKGRTVSVSDESALLASAGSGTAMGSYEITVEQLATANKIASNSNIADDTADLNFTGDLLLNGKTISLKDGDTLVDLRDAINNAGAGVNASIVSISSTEHRMVLTSLQTGVDNAIELVDANDSGLLQSLGLLGDTLSVGKPLTNGAASSYLSSITTAVGSQLNLTVAPQGEVQINGTAVNINLSSDSLQSIADRINATVSGVQASVTTATVDGKEQSRLEITGETGTPTFTDDGAVLQTLGILTREPAHEISAAKNAIITIDGQTIERNSNSIDDAVEGFSLDLLKAAPGTAIAVDVEANTQQAVASLQTLITSYNSVIDSINTGLSFDSDSKKGGAFFGDYSIINIQSGLSDQAMNAVTSIGGSLSLMSQIGIDTDGDNKLVLDTEKLTNALESDPDGVLRLLTTRAETTNASVVYETSTTATQDSGESGFAVNITQAATKATALASMMVSGITQTETLTFGGRYDVTLQAGDSLQAAVDKLNAVFSGNGMGMTATIQNNRLVIQSNNYGSFYAIQISSSLAHGSGGTDLGGETAGTTQVYAGLDVQGTIGGSQCQATGYGQWLTASTGPAKGLRIMLQDSDTGDHGTVKVSKGLASRLAGYTAQITDEKEGALTRASGAVTDSIDRIQEEIDRVQKSIDSYIERLQTKFASAEAILARNKSTLALITNNNTSAVDTSA